MIAAVGARNVETTIQVGDLVTIVRPPGIYKFKGDRFEIPQPSRPIITTPLAIEQIREAHGQRECWVVLANHRAYPAAWIDQVEHGAEVSE